MRELSGKGRVMPSHCHSKGYQMIIKILQTKNYKFNPKRFMPIILISLLQPNLKKVNFVDSFSR